MGVLFNQRHELVCQYVVAGETWKEAVAHAGYKRSGATTQAYKMKQMPAVLARIKELKKKIEKQNLKSIMSSLERQQRLSEFAAANIVDFIDDNGDIVIDKRKQSARAISEYSTVTRLIPRKGQEPITTIKKNIKLQPQITAIDTLNRMTGEYNEQPPQGNTNIFNIIVMDGETKDLISQVKERTRKIIEG